MTSALRKLLGQYVGQYWSILGLLVLWQIGVGVSGVNRIVLPHPADVVREMLAEPGLLLRNGAETILLATLGLALGLLAGTGVAILAWMSSLLKGLLTPLVLILASVPVVALIPILARLLGYDIGTVLAIVVIITSFPAYIFTSAGLRLAPAGADDLFRVFGASRRDRFLRLVAPAALPSWAIALRLAAPPAILSAMVAEYLMGMSGLGFLLRTAAADLRSDRAFATTVVSTVISMICFALALRAERAILDRWS